jgi:hypothetical protein
MCDVANPTKNSITKVAADVTNAQTTEDTCGSGMVAKAMMEIPTAHVTRAPVTETSQALEWISAQGPRFTAVKRSRRDMRLVYITQESLREILARYYLLSNSTFCYALMFLNNK